MSRDCKVLQQDVVEAKYWSEQPWLTTARAGEAQFWMSLHRHAQKQVCRGLSMNLVAETVVASRMIREMPRVGA